MLEPIVHEKTSSPGRDLVRTVAKNDLESTIFSIAEVALDHNLAQGIIRDIPFVSTLASLVHVGRSISDELLIRKLIRFLTALKDVQPEERLRILEKYPDESEEQRALGENLLLALERLNDTEKPALLARFFAAYIREEIDYTIYTRLAIALEKFNLALFPYLRWYYTRQGPVMAAADEIEYELSLTGLILVQLSESGTLGGSAGYRHSSLGKAFLRIGFNIEV